MNRRCGYTPARQLDWHHQSAFGHCQGQLHPIHINCNATHCKEKKNCFQSRSCIIPELMPKRLQITCRKKELQKLPVNLDKLQISLTGATISHRRSNAKPLVQPTVTAVPRLYHLYPVAALSAFQAPTAVLPLLRGFAIPGRLPYKENRKRNSCTHGCLCGKICCDENVWMVSMLVAKSKISTTRVDRPICGIHHFLG